MLFNSFEFAVFFPLVVGLYFTLPDRLRVPMLLVASCVFYMAFIPVYILILFITIGIDYVAGIYLEKCEGKARKALLLISILSTCAVLFIFKYYNFFIGSADGMARLMGTQLDLPFAQIILPIGLSFHTFQSLSYVVEVYRGKQKAEKNLVVYATYVMFFPQLVAGPIERPQNLLHQFYEHHEFEYDRVTSGLKRMAWGYFKKLVVADRLALYVNDVYGAPKNYNGLQLSIATVFFAYQIYCDFSGYSDIAIGTARILGFRLMENFDTPYYSRTISEFWHRWHISLSTWFRDYVYYPMGGNRVNVGRWCLNILVVFCVSGLWHGANWTYVVWGALNGVYLLSSRVTWAWRQNVYGVLGLDKEQPLRVAISIVCTFLLTCAGWVVFRAHSLNDAAYVLTHFWRGWDFSNIKTEQFIGRQMPVALASILLLELVQLLNGKVRIAGWIKEVPSFPRWAAYVSFVFVVILFGVFGKEQFIYFQF
jgi:D-alanyl-lipoteichoic acid acyltransferase DltB (MBOAT superfamily)